MTKSLTTVLKNTSLSTLSNASLADALEEGQRENDSHGHTGDLFQFLSFSGKKGVYSLGKAKTNLDPEDVYFIDPTLFLGGWICWKGGKPVGRIEWPFIGGKKVPEDELEDHSPYNAAAGDGWSDMLGLCALSLDGEKTQIKYTTNTVSAKNAISDLVDEVKARARKSEPACPIMHFDIEEFTAQGQKNFKPKFEVEQWVTPEQMVLYTGGVFSLDDLLEGKVPSKAQLKQIAA
jgi:hypothetical protein